MNQSINTDSKNSKEPQQKYRLGTVSIKILGGLNRFYGRPTSPSASVMAQKKALPTKHAKHFEKMADLTYAELTQGRESTRLPQTHKFTSLKSVIISPLHKIDKRIHIQA